MSAVTKATQAAIEYEAAKVECGLAGQAGTLEGQATGPESGKRFWWGEDETGWGAFRRELQETKKGGSSKAPASLGITEKVVLLMETEESHSLARAPVAFAVATVVVNLVSVS